MVKHLIKECRTWRKERETSKKELSQSVWNHRSIGHIFADHEKTKHILNFLEKTEVGNRTPEK